MRRLYAILMVVCFIIEVGLVCSIEHDVIGFGEGFVAIMGTCFVGVLAYFLHELEERRNHVSKRSRDS